MAAAVELWENRDSVLQMLLEKTSEAEVHREEETNAAVRIQKHFRGYMVRASLATLTAAAIVIQSCYRMYKGQLKAEAQRRELDRRKRERYFHLAAVEIQRHWRGYSSRTKVHDYYARARYIQKVLERTEELREASTRLAEGILRQQQVKEEEERQQAYDARLRSLHHLLSTKSMPGVLDGLTLNDTIENDAVGAFDIESKIKTLNKSLHHRHMIIKS